MSSSPLKAVVSPRRASPRGTTTHTVLLGRTRLTYCEQQHLCGLCSLRSKKKKTMSCCLSLSLRLNWELEVHGHGFISFCVCVLLTLCSRVAFILVAKIIGICTCVCVNIIRRSAGQHLSTRTRSTRARTGPRGAPRQSSGVTQIPPATHPIIYMHIKRFGGTAGGTPQHTTVRTRTQKPTHPLGLLSSQAGNRVLAW